MSTFKNSYIIIAILMCFPLGSCSILDIKKESELVENVSYLHGKVVGGIHGHKTYIAIYKYVDGTFELRDHRVVERDGSYEYRVLPNQFGFGAFVDINDNGKYERDEPATYLGIENNKPEILNVKANETIKVKTLRISGPIEVPEDVVLLSNEDNTTKNTGKVVSLTDPIFSDEASSMGLWQPVKYIKTYGSGLFFLQPYSENRIPVVFVHGIGGSATTFIPAIETLDKTRFQPWVLQYASGLRLDILSSFMDESLNELYERYHFKEIIVVAHSMGGLVARSYVMKHQNNNRAYRLRLVVTIDSPLYGMISASSGVHYSPIVVPAWRDVASDSQFIAKLHEWTWPNSVPYFLIFSYLPGEDGDGVVPMESQLSPALQEEAVGMFGFKDEHTAILRNDLFIKKINEVLENY